MTTAKEHSSTDTSPRKTVRFSESVSCIPASVAADDHDASPWYDRDDFGSFKQNARLVAQDSRKFGSGSLLDDSFTVSNSNVQYSLNRWTRLSRRGLEYWSNANHGIQRDREKRKSIKCVLSTQKIQKNSGDSDPERLAQLSRKSTKNARKFAVKMAAADEHAVSATLPTLSKARWLHCPSTFSQERQDYLRTMVAEHPDESEFSFDHEFLFDTAEQDSPTTSIPGQCTCGAPALHSLSICDENIAGDDELPHRESLDEIPHQSKCGYPTAA